MKWALRLSAQAVHNLYELDRALVRNVWATLHALAEEPNNPYLQVDEDDSSLYWLAVEGDITVWVEIVDEQHAIRVVKIS